jgi:hypothetical protein
MHLLRNVSQLIEMLFSPLSRNFLNQDYAAPEQVPVTQRLDTIDWGILRRRILDMNSRLSSIEAAEERYRLQILDQIGYVRQVVNENLPGDRSLYHMIN